MYYHTSFLESLSSTLFGIIPLTNPKSGNKVQVSYSAFNHLRRSLFSKRDDIYIMLTAYFDDSGTDPGNKVAVVAGYVSNVVMWEKFETAWRNLLQRHEITSLRRTDLETFNGEFKSWNPEKRI